MGGGWGQWKKSTLKPSQNQSENLEVPLQRNRGPHTRMVFQVVGAVTLQREQPRGAFRNACLTNILLTFADSLLHCLFFLVPWMCWFLSLLLGLCPRHCIISMFVFGSCVGGRYLHLDTNINIVHPQATKYWGSEAPWHEKKGRDTLLLGRAITSITAWHFAPPPAFGLAVSSSPPPPNCLGQWI